MVTEDGGFNDLFRTVFHSPLPTNCIDDRIQVILEKSVQIAICKCVFWTWIQCKQTGNSEAWRFFIFSSLYVISRFMLVRYCRTVSLCITSASQTSRQHQTSAVLLLNALPTRTLVDACCRDSQRPGSVSDRDQKVRLKCLIDDSMESESTWLKSPCSIWSAIFSKLLRIS